MSNVIDLPVITTVPIPAEKILRRAIERDLQRCMIIGVDQDGEMYFCSTHSDGPETLWLMEQVKAALLEVGREG